MIIAAEAHRHLILEQSKRPDAELEYDFSRGDIMSVSSELAQFKLMSTYNQWMNDKLYNAAAELPAGEFEAERGAFFGSLAGTLHHLVLGDTIWLQRFAAHSVLYQSLDPVRAIPPPTFLSQQVSPPIAELLKQRLMLDGVITSWVGELRDEHLDQPLQYTRLNGERYAKRFGSVLLHFFNHQTHHRGQASTLLFQAGIDIGPTDLLVLIPDAAL